MEQLDFLEPMKVGPLPKELPAKANDWLERELAISYAPTTKVENSRTRAP